MKAKVTMAHAPTTFAEPDESSYEMTRRTTADARPIRLLDPKLLWYTIREYYFIRALKKDVVVCVGRWYRIFYRDIEVMYCGSDVEPMRA